MSENNISIIEQYVGKYPWFSEGYFDVYKAMCSLEGDVGITYLNKAAAHVWSRSKLYEVYKETLIEQAKGYEDVSSGVAVEDTPVAVAESPAVVIESPAVVIESPTVVIESPTVVIESPPAAVESPAVVAENPVDLVEKRLIKPATTPAYREYELIELDEEDEQGRDIIYEDNSFIISENKPKFVLAGGDYFSKKDFELIELDRSQPLDNFIAEKPTLLRSAIIGKGIKPVAINETESAEIFDDASFYTETLASIYIEQGFHKRALDVYAKLILLFPEKSSYFATLVKDIKNKYNT